MSMRGWYLKTTSSHRLHIRANDNKDGNGNGDGDDDGDAIANEIIGYTDSDWASDGAGRKSRGGYVFLCNGGAISRQSRKQDLVAASTTEAEYIACSEAP